MRVKKEINIEIGARIKLTREQQKMTQEELADRLDVLPQYVSDIECGRAGLSLPAFKRICTTLGVSSDSLLFGQTTKDRTQQITGICQALTDEQFALLVDMAKVLVKHF